MGSRGLLVLVVGPGESLSERLLELQALAKEEAHFSLTTRTGRNRETLTLEIARTKERERNVSQ